MQRYLVLCMALLAQVSADDCPDGGACEEGNTCCKVPSDGYECCPMYQAECCEDHIHCCPEGTLCVVNESMCVNGTVSLPWVEKVSAKQSRYPKSFRMISAYAGDEDDNICPDNSHCPAEFSCLKATTGYGCCPIAHAVPCSDGKHCCPEGHQCSTDSSSCIKQKEPVVAVLCSDRVSECPEGTTCCETPDGSWGCCPMPKAVCCEDKIHCCPEGSTCDIKQSKCISTTNKEMPMWAKFPARKRAEWENQNVAQVTTPIPDTTTSANRSPASLWEGEGSSPPFIRTRDVPCDESVACQDGTTCCKTQEGGWACCPLPQAVCCSDFIHCCPHGKKCNLAAQTCDDTSGSPSEPWLKKVPAVPREGNLPGNVTCDPTHMCPDNTTCCKTASGDWACCPMPEAVCCEDHEHCCPHGTTCDLASLACDGPSGPEPMVGKVPALTTLAPDHEEAATDHQGVQMDNMEPPTDNDEDVPCDESVACQDGTTCCKTQEGGWACCPLPQAVCCSDFIHCCPHGKKCNLAAQTCDNTSGSPSEPWLKKVPAVPREGNLPGNVTCDPTHMCPDNTTCCKTASGDWACCPMPEAVCCEDHEHCCPHGTTCDLASLACDGPSGPEPMVGKVPALTTLAPDHEEAATDHQRVQMDDTEPPTDNDEDVPCDESVACQDGTTCCKTQEGGWACCPLPQAVCCSDFIHCCPHGKKCNLAAQTCDDTSGSPSEPWLKKVPAVPREGNLPGNVTCDPTHMCPDNTTCCKTASGDWACCPMPEAVCCEDHEHCCPHGTTCDLASLACDGPSGPEPMVGKVPALTNQAPDHEEAPADHQGVQMDEELPRTQCDTHTSCPKDATCCFMKSTQKWGCCPLPQAVCCADGEHCCPKDYICDMSKTSCSKGVVVIPWYNKLAAEPDDSALAAPPSVKCDAQNSCPEGSSCCQLSTGQWGCCPLCKAVCCADEEHCCPQGYSCNMGSGTCQKLMFLQFQTIPLTRVSAPEPPTPQEKEIHCGGPFVCNNEETCCKVSTTTWGCCPSPNAVCCSDMKHCCTTGYTCGEGGTCTQSTGFNWDHWQVFFSNKKRALRV
ncbi:progranulin-like isoform X2 [Coregonus clupeaformis]|uniref:progranulin-like isoform X2 n=1 Tax=Coregonus clupeaformis TaxID=59861 RepID=UPI001E1C4BC0|nr:progranulin-like isoform X2 [Coregonus clupeaformis]